MQQTTDQNDAIDPRFGYIGTDDGSKPVEPDHTIDLQIKPRENAPFPEFYFEPSGLAIDVGDTVQFNLATPHHNVNAYHPAFGYTQRVPEGVAAFSSPILAAGDYWLYTFESEGVHDIMCASHEVFGMVGRIVVGSASGPGANPVGEAPGGEQARPPEYTAALVLTDDAMQPDNIVKQGSVSWSDPRRRASDRCSNPSKRNSAPAVTDRGPGMDLKADSLDVAYGGQGAEATR